MTRFVHIIGKYFLLLLAFTAVLFTSCKRDALLPPIYEGDGREVTVNIPVYFTEYEQKTRALTEKESKRLDNLYLFAFQSSTGKLQYRRFYDTAELLTLSDAVSQDKHSDAKVVPITLPTGTYKIAAVANCNAGHLTQGVQDRLLQIENWDEFYAVDLELNEYNPLTRSRMPMSGYYQIGDNVDCAGTLTCPDVVVNGQGDLGGYIHLRRVDAEVKFNIYNDIDGHYAGLDGSSGDYMQTCTKFEVLGWQLVNMPAGAYLAEHESDKPDVTYVSTGIQGIDRPDPNVGDGAWTLDFYMMENRKSSIGLTKYEQRELNEANEEREEDEDPHFIKAPSNSTYLKFSANIEIALTKGSETVKRIASATYYVHLGATYPKGGTPTVDYNDFNTARNTKYTYNVRVQGVDKIVVEAISTEDPNDKFQNGQEGMVVDLAGGKVIDLDAHYAVFNIELSRLEISQMGLIITSAAHPSGVSYIPGAGPGGSDLNNLNITCDDYQHIRFAPLAAQKEKTPGSELVVYSNTYDVKALSEHPTEAQAKEGGILPLEDEPTQAKDTDHYVPLYDFITLKKSYPLLDDGHDEDPITFTVFVSEYYYYNDFNLHHDTDLGEENWQKFTNTINRQYSLLSNVHVSSDEHSTHVTGKYVINQRSIQTYYGMDSEEGLGIEHVNEHYHKNMYASNPSNKRKNNGWFNSAFYMGLMNGSGSVTNSARWADWASQDRAIGQESTNDFYPTFKTKFSDGLIADGNYKGGKNGISTADRNVNYDAIPACLARNRDLNRNGIIETDELRWFLPGIQQYVQFAIGIAALETPIFRPSDFVNGVHSDTKGGNTNNIYGNFRYHFISSDNWKMWSEEGTSISTLSGASVASAWEIRCCRYLKAHGAYTSSDNQLIVAHPYNHNDETRVVNVHGYDEKCIRENTAVLPVRDNFDTKWNSLARNFQYASTTITRPNAGTMAALARDVDANVYCRNYHDPAFGSDMSDVGTWRIPNQRELAIMFYEGKADNGYFAGTFWYYGNHANNIVYGYDDVAAENGSKYFGNFGIRSNNLCLNHSNNLNGCTIIRCVRDTDKDGNYMNAPEYGNPLNFEAGEFECTYIGDLANYTVNASMDGSVVSSVSVTIDDLSASTSGSGAISSTVNGATVDKSQVVVNWTIVTTAGKTLRYSRAYQLPACYWMISRYGNTDRYYYTDVNDNNRVTIASPYSGNLDDREAVYKWIITKNPTSNPVNEQKLELNQTYYLYNAATHTYVDGGASNNRLTTGGTPAPFQLKNRGAGYENYYGLYFTGKNQYINGNGTSSIGFWGNFDDGSTHKLSPVVLKGSMPLYISVDETLTESGSDYEAGITISGSEISTLAVTATINGISASVRNDGDRYMASIEGHNDHIIAEVHWSVNVDGYTHNRDKVYVIENRIPDVYMVISQKNNNWFVYNNNNQCYSETSNNATPIQNLADKYKWILVNKNTYTQVTSLPSVSGGFPIPSTEPDCYMYNIEAKKFVSGPISNNLKYIPLNNESPLTLKVARNTNGSYTSFSDMYCFYIKNWGWINRISENSSFGTWNTNDNRLGDGNNAWRIRFVTPEDAFTFEFGSISKTADSYSISATMDEAASIVSVTFDGVAASFTKSGTAASASLPSASLTNPYGFTATWTISRGGQTYVRSKYYVADNTSYWAFRHSDGSPRPYVYADNGIVKFKSESTPSDESRWVLQEKASGAFVTSYNSASSYSDRSSTQYVLFNIGTGMYLGPQNSSNIMTVVSGKENAQAFVVRFNGNHECIHFINPDGSHKGWAFRNDGDATVRLQVSNDPSHGWKLWYPDHN